jgi:hypothetical protein
MKVDKEEEITEGTRIEIDVLRPGEDHGEPVSEVKQGYIYAAERGFLFQPRCHCPDSVRTRLYSTISEAKEALSGYCAECINCLAPNDDDDLPPGCAYTANSYSLDKIQEAIDQCDEKCGKCPWMGYCDQPAAFKIERGVVAACRHFDFKLQVCCFDRQEACNLSKMETCQSCDRFTLDELNAMDQAVVKGQYHRIKGKQVERHSESQPKRDDESTTLEDIEACIGHALRDGEEI